MRRVSRILTLTAGLAAASSAAFGYAHWVFYGSRSAPFNPISAAFNLNALANNTISYFVSDQGPGTLMPGDSFANILSQIEAAANVWNQVATSSIRLAFGGVTHIDPTRQSAPGIDVVFSDDVPPGLLAYTTLSLADTSQATVAPSFVPIQRSKITLPQNLAAPNQLASYGDLFFLVAAHEFGHALGLQHTLTSGVMATQITSATTKSAPLSPDDVAAISLLYPTQSYLGGTASITGTVLVAGKAANMANVVALSPNGMAISTLSNPDGTFTIQGVPPGDYYVYAGPLPPAQQGESYPDNIVPPKDLSGIPFGASTGFDTEFFPATRDITQATKLTVTAGGTADGINFNLQPLSGAPLITFVETKVRGYYGGTVNSPSLYQGDWQVFLYGSGITTSKGLVRGLGVTAVGAASVDPGSLVYNSGYAEVNVTVPSVANSTPVALVVTLPNDMYVLPYAFFAVANLPPWITGITPAGDASGTVNIAGSNLSNSTIVFDGAPARVLAANDDGSVTVAPPPSTPGYTAYVEALAPPADGQTSWQQLGSTTPYSFTYPGAGAAAAVSPSIVVNSGLLLPGATAMLDIIGVNTSFAKGQVSIGLGSSDISVDRVWVLNPQRVLADVSVNPQAAPGLVDLTVTSGLQSLALKGILQVQSAVANQKSLLSPVLNQSTGLAGTPAGGVALITTMGLPQDLTGWALYIDGIASHFQLAGNVLWVQVPSNLPPATEYPAAIVQLVPPDSSIVIPPLVMQIDAPPPVIAAVTNAAGVAVTPSAPVQVGDTISISVTGLTQSPTSEGLSSTQVMIGGVSGSVVVAPTAITPGLTPDSYTIQVALAPNTPYGPSQWVRVGIGTRISDKTTISILPAPNQ